MGSGEWGVGEDEGDKGVGGDEGVGGDRGDEGATLTTSSPFPSSPPHLSPLPTPYSPLPTPHSPESVVVVSYFQRLVD